MQQSFSFRKITFTTLALLLVTFLYSPVLAQKGAVEAYANVTQLSNYKLYIEISSKNSKIPEVLSIPNFGSGFDSAFAVQSMNDGALLPGFVQQLQGVSISIATSTLFATSTVHTSNLLFLAQPSTKYRVYVDTDDSRVKSAIDYSLSNIDKKYIHTVKDVALIENLFYKEKDIDSDGVADLRDNCPMVVNSSQIDQNSDGRGDECDDFDFDGIINSKDNCSNIPNSDQKDIDIDGVGDICDSEESRLTKKYPMLPWLGIVSAGAVLAILFFLTAKEIKKP